MLVASIRDWQGVFGEEVPLLFPRLDNPCQALAIKYRTIAESRLL